MSSSSAAHDGGLLAGRKLRHAGGWVIDHPLVIIALIMVGVGLYYGIQSFVRPHTVKAVFTQAPQLYAEQPVIIRGERVGTIESVEVVDGKAVVELGMDRWPLPQGTTALVRFGSTLCAACRTVDLIPGPENAKDIAEGGVIPEARTTTAVEIDDIFNMFKRETRKDIQGTLQDGARATRGQSRQIADGLVGTADTLEATTGLLADLGEDRAALSTLVDQGEAATETLAGRRETIEELLTVAAATFDEFGSNTAQIRASIEELAPTFRESRTTLRQLDGTLVTLDGLFDDLDPALAELRPLIRAARPVPARLRELSPVATETLRVLTDTAPQTTELLRKGQPFAQKLDRVSAGLAPQVGCVRPYTPEISSFFLQWSSWAQYYDDISHYGRVKGNMGATSNTNTRDTNNEDFLNGPGRGLDQAIPYPPGLTSDDPWFIPECGAGPDALDPGKDPEEETR